MRRSLNKSGFTGIDHITFDVILPLLSVTAQIIFLRIYRQTVGWNKPTDKIANSHFQKCCNIKNHETVKIAIDELLEMDLITAVGKNTQIKEFGIKWQTIDSYRERYLESLDDEE